MKLQGQNKRMQSNNIINYINKNEKIRFSKIDLLKNSLSEFGLNPNEWNLKQISDERYIITLKADQDFVFLGLAKQNTKPEWLNLNLMSI